MSDTRSLDDLPQPAKETTTHPNDLEVDGDNPNEMDEAIFEELKSFMVNEGWVGNAIVADMDMVICDGEHRWRAARDIGLEEVPVKMYDLSDSKRRLWRQRLNKTEGEHDPEKDNDEFEELLGSSHESTLTNLLDARDEEDVLDDLTDSNTPDFDPVAEDNQPRLDEVEEGSWNSDLIECPDCGHEFHPDE